MCLRGISAFLQDTTTTCYVAHPNIHTRDKTCETLVSSSSEKLRLTWCRTKLNYSPVFTVLNCTYGYLIESSRQKKPCFFGCPTNLRVRATTIGIVMYIKYKQSDRIFRSILQVSVSSIIRAQL